MSSVIIVGGVSATVKDATISAGRKYHVIRMKSISSPVRRKYSSEDSDEVEDAVSPESDE